ncbi:MAG TPA: Lrp/AsnC ligand binding domain-containing protein [Candidatus Nanoarchaeia archaeon]|nr:Lrp/AsnC ligand binding domain-containing protein [Candidatus Nanoarchaeia archaeon]
MAYVLIAVEGAEPSIVAKELNDIEEIDNIHLIFGEYNIIAVVKAKTLVNLKEVALERITKVRGVVKTSSLIVADEN